MKVRLGFHILLREQLKSINLRLTETTHIITWLREICEHSLQPHSFYVIEGFECLFSNVLDQKWVYSYFRKILTNSNNFLLNTSGIFLFPIDGDIEVWQQPIIRTEMGDIIELVPIFGNVQQLDANWFHQQLNVQS